MNFKTAVPVGRRSHAQRREEAIEKLLEAAVACVAERGLEGFTLADVGKRAGVSRSLANYHFGDKDGLVDQLVDWLFESHGLGAIASQKARGLQPLLDAVAAYLDNLVAEPVACRALAILQGYGLSDERIASKLRALSARAVADIESHLRAGLDKGEVNGAVHAKNDAVLILASLRAAVCAFLLQPDVMSVEELRMAFLGSLQRSLEGH